MFELLQIKDSTSQTVQIINAVNNSWPILLIVIGTIVFILYRKKIGLYFSRFNKLSGKTALVEVNFEKQPNNNSFDKISSQENKSPNQAKSEDDEINKSKPEEPSYYAIYLALTKGEISKADSIFQQIQDKVTDQVEKEKNYLYLLSLKYHYSATNTLSEIEKIATTTANEEVKFTGYKYLGQSYSKANEFTLARGYYEKALSFYSPKEKEKSEVVFLIADSLFQGNQKKEAIEYLKNAKELFSDRIIKAKFFATIAKYYENDENWIEKCLAMELATANDPNNTTNLFETAYVYSNKYKNNTTNRFVALSLLHYKDLLSYEPDSASAFNNIGVAYDNLNLPSKSISSYKKSSELKNTLASANLSNKLISIGCFDEALSILNKIKDDKDVHENVWSALKRIKENSKEENDNEENIMQHARTTQLFLREFATLHFSSDVIRFTNSEGNWKINGLNVEAKQLTNPDYYEFRWMELENKFTITLNIKNSTTFIGRGEYIKTGRYSADELDVFSIINNESFKLLLYDREDSKGFYFVLSKS